MSLRIGTPAEEISRRSHRKGILNHINAKSSIKLMSKTLPIHKLHANCVLVPADKLPVFMQLVKQADKRNADNSLKHMEALRSPFQKKN